MYERILEMDKRLDVAKKQLQVCEDRERKLQKEMVKGSKTPGVTQEKLQLAVDAKNLASTECEYVLNTHSVPVSVREKNREGD